MLWRSTSEQLWAHDVKDSSHTAIRSYCTHADWTCPPPPPPHKPLVFVHMQASHQRDTSCNKLDGHTFFCGHIWLSISLQPMPQQLVRRHISTMDWVGITTVTTLLMHFLSACHTHSWAESTQQTRGQCLPPIHRSCTEPPCSTAHCCESNLHTRAHHAVLYSNLAGELHPRTALPQPCGVNPTRETQQKHNILAAVSSLAG
jgi:hypothetical protein